jgi:cyclopropane fatty-acyl-phospholipid synthase-like methyltransferase
MNKNNITSKDYWEHYYKKSDTDKQKIIDVCSVYNDYFNLFFNRSESGGNKILEIGGYPGRYLAYLASKYNLIPSSVDFNKDKKTIENCFKNFGINQYKIYSNDINNFDTKTKYDLVFSNGFVEHFLDFDLKLDQHACLCKKEGTIMVMIPNKTHFRRYYGYLCDYENLKKHNLKSMRLKVFKDFAKRNELEIISLDYFGGFPFSVHQDLNFFQDFIYQTTRIIFKYYLNPFIEKNPNKYFSSLIIGIFKK